MKKIIQIFLIFVTFIILAQSSQTQAITSTPAPTTTTKPTATATPTTSPTDAADIDRIQKIKDLVASKVAELKLVEKRGLLGTVTQTSSTQITIEDTAGNRRIIDIDELTKFQKDNDAKNFGVSDIKNGTTLSLIGLYNKETKRLLARFISKAVNIPVYFEGVVISKNAKDFTLKATDEKGTQKTIDVQSSTKISLYAKDTNTTKSGFTKVEIGQRILVAGFDDLKEKNMINASRLIHFKDLPPSAEMKKQLDIANLEKDTPVSTGSGTKLTPIKK